MLDSRLDSMWPRTNETGMRAWLTLGLLMLTLFFSYVDRFVLAILVQPIKADLQLTDTQIGLLTGFAFSLFFATFALPVARLADKQSRRGIICACLVAWSVMTALCGAAQNFWQLLIARFGVGAGEAGAGPASQAMVADLFPLERRATAMALLSLGGALGMVGGIAAGGHLETLVGWRYTFLIVALPGVVLAVLIHFLVKEPRRRLSRQGGLAPVPQHGTMHAASTSAFRLLWRNRPYRSLVIAYAATVFLSSGQMQWFPAFFERSFGVSRLELGTMLAASQGVGMMAGLVFGGLLSDHLSKRDILWMSRITVGATALFLLTNLALLLSRNAEQAYLFAAAMGFIGTISTGPSLALMQSMVEPQIRATSSAWSGMVSALIGAGGGPLLIGMLSDALAPSQGADGLRHAMMIAILVAGPLAVGGFVAMHRQLRQRIA